MKENYLINLHSSIITDGEPETIDLTTTGSFYEKDGKYYLDTNVYELIGDFGSRMINTDVLGKAFEPEQYFENPDGTPIQFDSDYFGDHRGTEVIPGPFACAEAWKTREI